MKQADAVSHLIGRVRDIRRIGAASLDLCSVASGRLDAYYEKGLKPWDHAAGALVAAEAGARVAGLTGAPASRTLTIAAEQGLFAQLEPVLDELDVINR
jgi:myo-inositol-1(or 4)-monophosphatase